MEIRPVKFNNQSGQTVVEYILLFSVAVSLVLTFYKSDAYQKIFGERGMLGTKIKEQNEFAYRHALTASGKTRERPANISRTNRDITVHPSYTDLAGETRFFGPLDKYGED